MVYNWKIQTAALTIARQIRQTNKRRSHLDFISLRYKFNWLFPVKW